MQASADVDRFVTARKSYSGIDPTKIVGRRIGCGGAVETKRKIMIAGTPKHNDNIHSWSREGERKEEEECDGEMDGWLVG